MKLVRPIRYDHQITESISETQEKMRFQKLNPASKTKKSTQVAERILEAIARGDFNGSNRMPSERQMALEFGISRPPVREAVSALQLLGVLESQTGDGTYVRAMTNMPLLKKRATHVLESNPSPFEVLQARIALESAIVEMACRNVEESDFERIENVLHRMEGAIASKDITLYFQTNRDFHLAVAQATQNVLMVNFLHHIFKSNENPLWEATVLKYIQDFDHVRRYLTEHQKILESLRARNVAKSKKLIRDHFKQSVKEVKNYL